MKGIAPLVLTALLFVSLAAFAEEKPETEAPDTSHGLRLDAESLRLMIGAQDIQTSLKAAERRNLLRSLANPSLDKPAWVPEFSTPPRMDVLNERRELRLNLFEIGKDEEAGFLRSPYSGFRLHVWEETPEIILDRREAWRALPLMK